MIPQSDEPLVPLMPGKLILLWDDDYTSDLLPRIPLPHLLDSSLLQAALNRVYVAPQVYAELPESDLNSPFVRNVIDDDAILATLVERNKDLESQGDFWSVHITASYQGWATKDRDPNGEHAVRGSQYGITPHPSDSTGGSLVHLETIRDRQASGPLEAYSLLHEIGHQFDLPDEQGDYPPPGAAGEYVMTTRTDDNDLAPNMFFSPPHEDKIRDATYPGE